MQRLARAKVQLLWFWMEPFKWRLGYFLMFIFFLGIKDFHIQFQFDTGNKWLTSENSNKVGGSFFQKKQIKGKEQVGNLSFDIPAKPNSQQYIYIKRFVDVARTEMDQFGIPASITLAQGLLESQAGKSPLAREANNHFGIKCFSKKCKKGHCKNFSDDHHKDFFRTYTSAWESFRAHSLFLQKNRYKHLLELEKTDYKNWAVGLKRAGYATDPNYAKKLIRLIENLDLDKFDV
ncbi:MAG: glycoside hydrolase family 73 protein [Saprospiraceae bacterium]